MAERRWSSRAMRDELTERQREVLDLMAQGLTNAQIAERLDISLDGAKYHVREILAKLQVDSREEAVDAWRTSQRPAIVRGLMAAAGFLVSKPVAIAATVVTVGAAAAIGLAVILADSEPTPPTVPAPTGEPAPTEPATSPRPIDGIVRLQPGEAPDAPPGEPVRAGEVAFALLAYVTIEGVEYSQSPVAAVNLGIVVRRAELVAPSPTAPAPPDTYLLWDPATGAERELFQSTPDEPVVIVDDDGDWLLLADSLAEENVRALNVATGEVVPLPGGHSIEDGIVYRVVAPQRTEIEAIDLATGTAGLVGGDLLGRAVNGLDADGGTIAWVSESSGADPPVVLGIESTEPWAGYFAIGFPTSGGLFDDGRWFAWRQYEGTFAVNLETEELVRLFDGPADLHFDGPRVWWSAFNAPGQRQVLPAHGWFDGRTGTVQTPPLAGYPGGFFILEQWLVRVHIVFGPGDAEDRSQTRYDFSLLP